MSTKAQIEKINYAVYHNPLLIPVLFRDTSIKKGLLYSRLRRLVPHRIGIEFECCGTLMQNIINEENLHFKNHSELLKYFNLTDYKEDRHYFLYPSEIRQDNYGSTEDIRLIDPDEGQNPPPVNQAPQPSTSTQLSTPDGTYVTIANAITNSTIIRVDQGTTSDVGRVSFQRLDPTPIESLGDDGGLDEGQSENVPEWVSEAIHEGEPDVGEPDVEIQEPENDLVTQGIREITGELDQLIGNDQEQQVSEVSYNEFRISIKDFSQLNGLYKLLEYAKKYCEIPIGGGIHIHVDFSNYKKYYDHIRKLVVGYANNNLDKVEKIFPVYDGNYNKRIAKWHGKASYINFSYLNTLEFRIAPLTFDYEQLIPWIIDCSDFVGEMIRKCHLNSSKINSVKVKEVASKDAPANGSTIVHGFDDSTGDTWEVELNDNGTYQLASGNLPNDPQLLREINRYIQHINTYGTQRAYIARSGGSRFDDDYISYY